MKMTLWGKGSAKRLIGIFLLFVGLLVLGWATMIRTEPSSSTRSPFKCSNRWTAKALSSAPYAVYFVSATPVALKRTIVCLKTTKPRATENEHANYSPAPAIELLCSSVVSFFP